MKLKVKNNIAIDTYKVFDLLKEELVVFSLNRRFIDSEQDIFFIKYKLYIYDDDVRLNHDYKIPSGVRLEETK